MTERADKLHHDNGPAHSTALMQAPFSPPTAQIGSQRLLAFLKAKIAVEREEICKRGGHTVHRLGQRANYWANI
jgi:hypothetical protein